MITLHTETSHCYSQTAYPGWVLQPDTWRCRRTDLSDRRDEDPPLQMRKMGQERAGHSPRVGGNRTDMNTCLSPSSLSVSFSFFQLRGLLAIEETEWSLLSAVSTSLDLRGFSQEEKYSSLKLTEDCSSSSLRLGVKQQKHQYQQQLTFTNCSTCAWVCAEHFPCVCVSFDLHNSPLSWVSLLTPFYR